jgi:Protein of unknown function (DUF3570)
VRLSARQRRDRPRPLDVLPRVLVALACLVFTWLAAPSELAAENRVTIRGNYYRERSTRILQPMVHVTVDAPDERLTVGAAYLLDAISSASIAAGTNAATGGDKVFTELRHEAIGTVSSRLGEWTLGAFFRYSTETDWISRVAGLSVARDLLQRTITVTLGYSVNIDRVSRIQNNTNVRAPWCGGAVASEDCSAKGTGVGSNLLQIHHLSAGYAHVLHKTVLALVNLEYAYQRGPQDNPYRKDLIVNALPESHPRIRNRFVIAPGVRWAIPKARMVLEPFYSLYADDWKMITHSPELRVHVRAARHLRLRARYRYYTQSAAFFWRADNVYVPATGQCTRDHPENCATADVKAMPWDSHTVGGQLTWELDGLARHRGLHWLEGGYFQATYDHVFQHNRFGNARVGALEMSLAF